MFYPEDFKARVKKAYPTYDLIHQKIENGEDFPVGIRLQEIVVSQNFSIKKILEAVSLEDLQDEAREVQEKVDLYFEWEKLFHQQENR